MAFDRGESQPRAKGGDYYALLFRGGLSVEFGGRNNAIVPREAYEALPEAVKPLLSASGRGGGGWVSGVKGGELLQPVVRDKS